MKNTIQLIFFLFLIPITHCFAKSEPPKIGNFALPTSQQPGPLVGFGENIIEKNQIQLFYFADDYAGNDKHTIDVIPSVLWGITDKLSLYFNFPFAASYKMRNQHSFGFEDIYAQLEYVFYSETTSSYADQATVVANITFPTGSGRKLPPTGFDAPSGFIGATFNRTYTDWFYFTSHGAIFPTEGDNNTLFGKQFFYEAGFGKNICSIPKQWIFAWMAEITGQYSQKNRILGIIDENSGGNLIFLTPSLWVSSKTLILELGLGWAISQHLFGDQPRSTYLVVGNVGWTFG